MIETYLDRFEMLYKSLTDLEQDIQHRERQTTLYYTVDFSELYAYLNINHKSVKQLGVEINEPVAKSYKQHSLSLSHLFNSLTEMLYLLPPHAIELWSYSRDQVNTQPFSEGLIEAKNILKQIPPADADFLNSLETNLTLTKDEERRLFTIVKDDFEKLCTIATDFCLWKKQANNLQKMLGEGKVSYIIENLLESEGLTEANLEHITLEQELLVLDYFYKVFTEKEMLGKYDQKVRDSRAILYIRNLNRQLASRNGRLNFVTRDKSIKHVCQLLKGDINFDCPDIDSFLRTPETVFFDLILLSCETNEEKLTWIKESKEMLNKLQSDLMETNLSEKPVAHSKHYFEQQSEGFLNNIFEAWSQRINIQLSIAAKSIPLLSDFNLDSENGADRKSIELLASVKNLFEFVRTNEYEQKAIKEARKVFTELVNDGFKMHFLKHLERIYGSLDKISVNRIMDTTSEGFSLISPSSSMMPFIRFTSETYEKRLGEFKQNLNIGSQSSKELMPLIEQATSGVGEAEDFMFMAFILGVMRLWKDALKMVERALVIETEIFDAAQATYFRAFILRKLGESCGDLSSRIEHYEFAANDVKKALLKDSNDPRYLKEYAAIVLLYKETWRELENSSDYQFSPFKLRGQLSYLDLGEAKQCLKKAWEEIQKQENQFVDDIRLKIEILNNILYAEFLSDDPDRKYGQQIISLINEQKEIIKKSQPVTTVGIEPFVKDSEVMFKAKIASIDKDAEALKKCIEELKEISKNRAYSLSEYQKESNIEHLSLLRKLLEDVIRLQPEFENF